jgi:iron complex transport system ATP-binding protein
MDAMTIASFRNVSFGYGGSPVLREISFDLREGEMTGVVGPNGSGKTTLIRLLCGLLEAESGEVTLRGRPLVDYSRRELSLSVAVVPQATETVFPYTVEEMVAMGRYPHLKWGGWLDSRDLEVCEWAMDLSGILPFRLRTLDRLSAGERQRVLLARALAQKPSFLLLDEASSFLDIGQEVAVFDLLDRLRREEGLTVLTVSHDLNLIGRFCAGVLLLREGRLLAQGCLSESYTSVNLSALFGVPVAVEERSGGGVRTSW